MSRNALRQTLATAGREQSEATVLFHTTVAAALGLNPSDMKALSLLDRLGPQSAGQIAIHTGLAAASITNLIDRLEAKGFARRVPDPADRRGILVELMPGRVAEAMPLFVSASRSLARLYARYSQRELATIADFMARNARRLRAETRKLTAG